MIFWYGFDSFSAISQRTTLLVAIKGLNKLKLTLSEDPIFHLRQLVLSLRIHSRRRNLVRDEKRDQFINRLWDGISLFSSVVGNTVLCSLFYVLLNVLFLSFVDIVFTLTISWFSKLLCKTSRPLHHLDAFCRLSNPLYLVK